MSILLERKEARSVNRGNLVVMETEAGEARICLKTEREGKEYTHHYLVQIDPTPNEGYCLLYIDPEENILDCGIRPGFQLENPVDITTMNRSELGYIIETPAGTFLKVSEDPKMQKFCGYVNIHSGEIKRRQERNVKAAFPEWQAKIPDDGSIETFAMIYEALGQK